VVTLTSADLKNLPSPISSIGLLISGIAAAALWVGGNIMLPWLAPTGIPSVVTRIAIHGLILTGLWLQRTDFAAVKRVRVWLALAVPFTIWIAAVWYLAATGAFQVVPGAVRLPLLPIAIFLPVIAALPLLLWPRSVGAVLDATPASWLIALQVYRVLGGIFLVNWLAGKVAGAFAWAAGVGDMATGIMALPVALAVASGTIGGRRSAYWISRWPSRWATSPHRARI
jgi:hypothetical protein